MYLNLSKPKPVLTPNPSPDRLSAADCITASKAWFDKAIRMAHPNNTKRQELALEKAVMYENMAFDGRK